MLSALLFLNLLKMVYSKCQRAETSRKRNTHSTTNLLANHSFNQYLVQLVVFLSNEEQIFLILLFEIMVSQFCKLSRTFQRWTFSLFSGILQQFSHVFFCSLVEKVPFTGLEFILLKGHTNIEPIFCHSYPLKIETKCIKQKSLLVPSFFLRIGGKAKIFCLCSVNNWGETRSSTAYLSESLLIKLHGSWKTEATCDSLHYQISYVLYYFLLSWK